MSKYCEYSEVIHKDFVWCFGVTEACEALNFVGVGSNPTGITYSAPIV